MALNIKVALVVCIVFIGGMCWVVNMVARPMLEVTTPTMVTASANGADRYYAGNFNPDQSLAFESPAAASTLRTTAFVRTVAMESPARLPAVAGDLSNDPATASAVQVEEAVVVHEPPLRNIPIVKVDPGMDLLEVEQPSTAELLETPRSAPINATFASNSRPKPDLPVQPDTTARPKPDLPVQPDLTARPKPDLPVQPEQERRYVVQSGDSLGKISQKFWGTASTEALQLLLACNPGLAGDANHIVVGDELLIPSLEHAKAMRDKNLDEASTQVALAPTQGRASKRLYTVRESDTLSKIAAEQLDDSSRWAEIAQLNNMKDADQILPGTQLWLPARNDT